MATSRMADEIGRVLGGRYRLVAPIGTGASAHVYLADDVTLSRRVALKRLHAALAEDEAFLRRFRAEARTVAALRHPNIMAVHDWGEDEDGPYLVLEHLAGGSLRGVLDAGTRLSIAQAARVGVEAARALDHAHRRGLVHRDIKPANLLFDDEGRLCIADFGLARALAEAAWTEPAGAVLGTARYASPEQATGAVVDGKADVYSLVLVLIEAVTGSVPFAADTTIGTLMGRVDRPLEVPEELGALGPALTRAGHQDPAQRLDAAQLAAELEAAARRLDAPAPLPLREADVVDLGEDPRDMTEHPASRTVPLYDHVTADDSGPFLLPEAPDDDVLPPRSRRRWPLALAALVLAVVLGVGGAWAFAQSRIPTHAVPSLRELTVAQARAKLAPLDLELRQSRVVFSENVPKGQIVDQDPSSGELKEGSTIRVEVSDGPRPRSVPSLAGLDQPAAEAALREVGLEPVVEGRFDEEAPKGAVLDWSPKEGAQPKGSKVTVAVSKGKEPRPVPNLVGKVFDKAREALRSLGFGVQREDAFSDSVPAGQVITTRPAPGSRAEVGGQVTLVVSKGPDRVAVPDVAGRSVGEAVRLLESAGLKVGGPYGPPGSGRAYSTTPGAGTKVARGSTVDLYVGR